MKAKLEIEMPEGCYDCQFCAGTECGVAEGMPTIDLFGEEGLRPKWCPLIPEEITRSRRDWYLKGYNDAKKEQKWIPVSERLPKDIVNPITRDAYVYPVTVDLGGITDIRYYSFCRGHWYNQGPKEMDELVIAWQARPEPYRP